MNDTAMVALILFMGLGAFFGSFISVPLAVIAILWPEFWPWVAMPMVVGCIGGAVFGLFQVRR